MLEKERAYFSQHHSMFVDQYFGKYVLIQGEEFIQAFGAVEEALTEGAKRYGLQSFLVREVTATKERIINIPALTLGILRGNASRPSKK